ncbi:MAG TPA: hypothetical protein VMB91_01715 [Solirubrobacteraceae bacterium]|nr:hypothetical protein [Solirubrobacteraceae bacterium]
MGLLLCGVLASSAYAKGSKPVITGPVASPSSVASGGSTTVSASVSGATTCKLSANKTVGGLPATFSCESGSVSYEVVMPQNAGKKAGKYILTLEATGAGGRAKAKLPVEVGTATAASITTDGTDTCAVLTTGHIKCWGGNTSGEVGDGKSSPNVGKAQWVPAEVTGISEAKEVETGGTHACALLETGHVECWGGEANGSLGNGVAEGPKVCAKNRFPCSLTPVEVTGITSAVQLGGQASCALLSSGHVECWGSNLSGALGNGISGSELAYSDVPVEVVGIADATQVSQGSTCAMLSSGHVECWGSNYSGRLGHGIGDAELAYSDVPVEALGISDGAQLAGTCALLSSGHVDCWGENTRGLLGDGTDTGPEQCGTKGQVACSTAPVEVLGITEATQVAQQAELAGEGSACALLSSGHVECWGPNADGQLGDGERETGPSLTPVQVIGLEDATQISASRGTACALLASGHIKCWGEGRSGQLGVPERTLESFGDFGRTGTPIEVAGI